jgi:hypothetical protein
MYDPQNLGAEPYPNDWQPQYGAPFAPAVRKRSTADIVATVLLCVLQLVASVLAGFAALLPSMWLMLPICGDNCGSAEVTHFVDKTVDGVVVIVCGVVLAFLLTAVGMVVAGVRRKLMWIWPALGVAMIVVFFLVACYLWMIAIGGS